MTKRRRISISWLPALALAGCGSQAPSEPLGSAASAQEAAAPLCASPSLACIPGEAPPAECGAAPCELLAGSNGGCCTPPPPIVAGSTPPPGNTCVSYSLVRTTGKLDDQTILFDVPCPSSADDVYTMVVDNGTGTKASRTSSEWVYLNGALIFEPSDFNKQVVHLEKVVTLAAGTNAIRVKIGGTPGASVRVSIRKAPFSIAVSQPLPAQCFNVHPTVQGTTNADCIAVTSNGAAGASIGHALTVAGVPLIESDLADLRTVATDWCGNTSTDDRKVIYDVTLPEISVSGFTDDEHRSGDVVPTYSITDANLTAAHGTLTRTSGAPYAPPGPADVVAVGPFESGEPLTAEGDYVLELGGEDCATNASGVTRRFTIDKTAPRISIAGVGDGAIYPHAVHPTFLVEDRNLASASHALTRTTGHPSVPRGAGDTTEVLAFTSGDALEADGDYALTVNGEDGAHNASAVTVRWTLDRTAPQITVAGVANGQIVAGSAALPPSVVPVFSAADRNLAGASATITFRPSGAAAAGPAVPFASGTALTLAGHYVLAVQASDTAGNGAASVVAFDLSVCGNGRVEPGEGCEGEGACCAACQVVPDGTACRSIDACHQSHVCKAGVCAGEQPNGHCLSTPPIHAVAQGAAPQTADVGGLGITIPAGTSITLNGVPQAGLDIGVGALPTDPDARAAALAALTWSDETTGSKPALQIPEGLPGDFGTTDIYYLEPSGARFSPPLQIVANVDPASFDPTFTLTPAAFVCSDDGATCEELPSTVADVTVDGRALKQLTFSLGHFSEVVVGAKTARPDSEYVKANDSGYNPRSCGIVVGACGDSPIDATAAPNWMEWIWKSIANLPLARVYLPGSHDAGSYSMTAPRARATTQAQGTNAVDQLNHGVRYFDLRVEYHPKGGDRQFYIHHNGYHTYVPVDDFLFATRDHLIAHPKEFVILHLTHFTPIANQYEDAAFKLALNYHIQRILGHIDGPDNRGNLLVRTGNIGKSLKELLALNQRVLVFSESAGAEQSESLWPSSQRIESPWFDAAAVGYIKPLLDAEVLAAGQGLSHPEPGDPRSPQNPAAVFWVLQHQLTPFGTGDFLFSVAKGADRINPLLPGWYLADAGWRQHTNVGLFDFVGWVDVSQIALRNNQLRDPCKNKACGTSDDYGGTCEKGSSNCMCVPRCTGVTCGDLDSECGTEVCRHAQDHVVGACVDRAELTAQPLYSSFTTVPRRCLDVQGGWYASETGAPAVQLYRCNDTPAQKWTAEPTFAPNIVRLHPAVTDGNGQQSCLTAAGDDVRIELCRTSEHGIHDTTQVWYYEALGLKTYQLRLLGSDLCVGYTPPPQTESGIEGTPLKLVGCDGSRWKTWTTAAPP